MSTVKSISESDKAELFRDLTISPTEAETVYIPSAVSAEQQQATLETTQSKLKDEREKFANWLKAAKQMQKVLAAKLKDRRVRVDPKLDLVYAKLSEIYLG